MKVRIINPSVDKRWDAAILNNDESSIYHSAAWNEVLERTFPQIKPLFFVLENQTGGIESGVAASYIRSFLTGNRIVSLPFTAFCNPIARNPHHAEKLIGAILSKVDSSKLDYVEFRLSKMHSIFKSGQFQISNNHVTHTLGLKISKEKLFQSFHNTSVRQNVKRAEKNGLKLIKGQNVGDVKKFFRLHLMTRKKIGLPSQPEKFFTNMFASLYPKKLLSLLLVEYSGVIIAATILLKFKNTVYSEYTAADPTYLRLRPNHWIFWKAIEHAKDQGFEYFDFGLSAKSNKGLIDFKRRWGGMQHSLYHVYYPKKPELSSSATDTSTYKAMRSLVKNMPLWFTKWSGKLLYQHLGG